MNKILNFLANKVMCTAVVALGAFAASAESVLTTNALYDAVNTDVSVGYQVSGLEGDEIAVVFTNDACEVINWKVPADLYKVKFLVVGGGGGGGGAASANSAVAGAGGGGGGVVTGVVGRLNGKSKITVKVGAGGLGGVKSTSTSTGKGVASKLSENSTFKLDGVYEVIAYGGGGDLGKSNKGDNGGSNAGSRRDEVNTDVPKKGYISDEFKILCEGVETFGYLGGKAARVDSYGSGGGGGAIEAGQNEKRKTGELTIAGRGGHGLTSDITGVQLIYGAGGGGGITKNAAEASGDADVGAGRGGRESVEAQHALANQGGGGGGGTKVGNGGNGGSGIVVFRFKNPSQPGFKVIVR